MCLNKKELFLNNSMSKLGVKLAEIDTLVFESTSFRLSERYPRRDAALRGLWKLMLGGAVMLVRAVQGKRRRAHAHTCTHVRDNCPTCASANRASMQRVYC